MTLRKKTLVAIGATLIGLVALLEATTQRILLNSFGRLEERSVREAVQRTRDTLENDIAYLYGKAGDWANWDDTYTFVEDGNREYIESNLAPTAFTDLRVNIFAFVRPSGQMVYAKAFDLDTEAEASLPALFQQDLPPDERLLEPVRTEEGLQGLLFLPDCTLMIAARPIMTSDGRGPARGVFILARALDATKTERLSSVTHLSLAFQRADDPALPEDFRTALGSLPTSAATLVQPANRDAIRGYTLLDDLHGSPALLLRVETGRDIYAQGQLSARSLLIAVIVAGLVFGAMAMLLVERLVLVRVARLSRGVQAIAAGGDFSARVAMKGADELARLAGTVDGLLAAVQRSEHELRESRRSVTTLMSNLPGMAYRCRNDRNWTMEFVSEGCRGLTGYEPADLIDSARLSFGQLIHPDDLDYVWNGVQSALREQRPFRLTYRVRTIANEEKWVWEQGRGLLAPTGEILALEGFIADITDNKRLEEALRAANEYNRSLIEASPDPIVILNRQGTITDANAATQLLTGRTRDELVGTAFADYATDAAAASAASVTVFERGAVRDHVLEVRHWDGRTTPVLCNASVYRDHNGDVAGVCAVLRDITERKRVEEALRASEARMRAITEAAQDAIVMMDPKGAISFWNPAAERVFGYGPEEVLGRDLHALLAPERYHGPCAGALAHFRESGCGAAVGKTLELQSRHREGHEFSVELSLSAIELPDGWHAVSIMRDITERKRIEAELKRAQQAAEAANLAKSEFLANMSHEIRTPMTAILGYVELIADGCPKRCEFGSELLGRHADTVTRNAKHLLNLISDILDLSKIEAGKLQTETTACSVPDLLADVESLMRVRAAAKNLAFTVTSEGLVPETIRTDPLRLRQILINLVGNAVKFTEEGDVRLIAHAGAAGELQFDIIDTGIGMTPEQVGRLFRPFCQGDATIHRQFGGTGLGLSISERLAELLGGRITVESEAGKGSTFRLTVATGPLEGAKLVEYRAVAPATRDVCVPCSRDLRTLSGRVLLAEDGLDNQRLIAHLLRQAGLDVTAVANGQEAADAALQAEASDQPFDVVLMDMQMPVLDGWAATRLLRQRGYAGKIIALTAHAMTADRERCLEVGCDDYATKPINRTRLLAVVAAHLPGTVPGRPGDAAPAEHAMHILAAEMPAVSEKIAALRRVLAENDRTALAALARQLQSAADASGFGPVARFADRLARAADETGDIATLHGMLDELIALCHEAHPAQRTSQA